jgi:DNA repair protein RecN (Recombination protein N)
MLRELRIENLLLIERAELRFEAGLNAITGETGAGKTVLARSLDLLLGGKPAAGIVRPGAPEAWVEGVFDLDPALREDPELADLLDRLPEDADEVVIARRVSAAGRSSAFLAGRAATAPDLRELGTRLLSFYGQHESRKLTLTSVQGEILDSYAGATHLELRDRYATSHRTVLAAERELRELSEREGARERDLDLLRFELAEIEELAPDPGEYDTLTTERNRLRAVEGLREGLAEALVAVTGAAGDASGEDGGAAAAAAQAESALIRNGGIDAALDALAERAGSIAVELADLGAELRGSLEALEADPERLEIVETRLDALDRLLRKHGGTIETVLEHARTCAAEIERLDRADELAGELEAAVTEAREERAALAVKLTKSRRKAAPGLERAVAAELAELAMDGARLEVALEPHPDGFGATGAELVELRVATNPGMPLSSLGETASGGELSRVMLALTGLGSGSGAETMVFDEIDAGIGGKVARRVGERLRALGSEQQLICITHLPQVASLAAGHFRVEKSPEGDGTVARVERVGGDELVAEIVRMLGADTGDEAADRHARELLAA